MQKIVPGPEVKLDHAPTFREVQGLTVLDNRFDVTYRCRAWSLRGALREFFLMVALWWHGWDTSVEHWWPFQFTAKWKREIGKISLCQEIRIRVRFAWITLRYGWWERIKIEFRYRPWLGGMLAVCAGVFITLLAVWFFHGLGWTYPRILAHGDFIR